MAKKPKKKSKTAGKKKVLKKKTLNKKVTRKAPPKKQAAKKKVSKKKLPGKKASAKKKIAENSIGKITHYFPHVRAAVIKLKGPLETGETIKIKGHTTDFKQVITSMQIDRVAINEAKKGQEIGLQVDSRVRQGDIVYKVK
jgi:hypothetical protein